MDASPCWHLIRWSKGEVSSRWFRTWKTPILAHKYQFKVPNWHQLVLMMCLGAFWVSYFSVFLSPNLDSLLHVDFLSWLTLTSHRPQIMMFKSNWVHKWRKSCCCHWWNKGWCEWDPSNLNHRWVTEARWMLFPFSYYYEVERKRGAHHKFYHFARPWCKNKKIMLPLLWLLYGQDCLNLILMWCDGHTCTTTNPRTFLAQDFVK